MQTITVDSRPEGKLGPLNFEWNNNDSPEIY